MQILLTNDDGYHAIGLQQLYKALKQEVDFKVSIVAPESQKSASGHSITLFDPLYITRYPLENNLTGFAVKGSPADCVKLAIQGEIVPRPDLVISGINEGPNLGTDVFYSGTVSAAMEGVLLGIPAIAVSLVGNTEIKSLTEEHYAVAANYLLGLIKEGTIPEEGLWNINIPAKSSPNWQGLKITKLGKAKYENIFEARVNPRGGEYFWQGGTRSIEKDSGTDLYAVQEDYISITPMHSDLTDYQQLDILKGKLK